ncbi:uncharacterized protein EI90DRAFT_3012290 [Cantharellus anzutake]|uniref:uncharacterized protein n=1 Tax=Cantharellus anzutake TaxID=1750568 RepID=UPI001905AFD0|nr:uncharacterized protein EI90DRAFT_3012290 [Cantharellus anzutake]KAF8340414.1 hypothetical protein EI90DRAFT_3012290 [Cantharellus anzutake]
MHDLNYYVLNRDKRAQWNDDHIMGLALPAPKNIPTSFPTKQKAEQEHTDHQQTAAAAALSTAAQPPVPPLPQLPYSTYPIMYPIVPFPSQPSIFLPQHPTSSPPIATLTPVPAAKLSLKSQLNERAEKLLGICCQCNTLNPDKVTTEASLHLPVDCAPSFVLEKIEEGMGVNVAKHEIGYLPTFDGKRRCDTPVQLKTVEHMEKALHELHDCLSRARTNKKLYIINMYPKLKTLGNVEKAVVTIQ